MPSWFQSEQIQGLDSEEVKDCCWVGLKASLVAQLVKNLPANVGDSRDVGSIPGSGRSSGEGSGWKLPSLPNLQASLQCPTRSHILFSRSGQTRGGREQRVTGWGAVDTLESFSRLQTPWAQSWRPCPGKWYSKISISVQNNTGKVFPQRTWFGWLAFPAVSHLWRNFLVLDPGPSHPLNDKTPGEQETHPSKTSSLSLNEEKQTNWSSLYPEQEDAGVKSWARDFPGGPVAKTPCSQLRAAGFNPWSGN